MDSSAAKPWDQPTVDLGSLSVADIDALDSVTIPSLTTAQLNTLSGLTYTSPTYTYNPGPWTIGDDLRARNSDIQLDPGADIKFGDVSLKQTLAEIAERLAILVPDAKLEQEYEELRQAREHYEHVKQKLTMLEKLKNTPVELPR